MLTQEAIFIATIKGTSLVIKTRLFAVFFYYKKLYVSFFKKNLSIYLRAVKALVTLTDTMSESFWQDKATLN